MVSTRRPGTSPKSQDVTKQLQRTSVESDKSSKSKVITWKDLEPWQRDNHYIHTFYRRASRSYTVSFLSLGYIHNESVNIYTHLLGALLFLAVAPVLYFQLAPRYSLASTPDLIALGCFFVGAVGCLGMSATYHAISNHSHAVAQFGNKLDYLGIVLLIWGSFVPSLFYGFACHEVLRTVYWGMITTIGLGCAITSTLSKFRTPTWRPFRAGMFAAMGLSAAFPVLHGLHLYGVERMVLGIGLPWMLLQGALYLAGAALYAARVPERLSPGTFDVWGSSHQIFHVLVLMAAVSHLVGLLRAFDYYHSVPKGARCLA